MNNNYLVVSIKSWNKAIFDSKISKFEGQWFYISSLEQLTLKYLHKINPRYIFFMHWSYMVPVEITSAYTCICFHMTDLPFGRGGSPLQNLIIRGFKETKISAVLMNDKIDAGPIFCKNKLSLEGTAEEIFKKAALIEVDMILYIIKNHPKPVPQTGETVLFKRRTFADSIINMPQDIYSIYDMIRMLDAEGYPRAYILKDGFKYEFWRPHINENDQSIEAQVKITKISKGLE
ncbi:methionyl-tRNA formyltransferase [Candidatus Magnetomorum sp. HK-1]|nr:methionyl-tRNA formyltransferase [Candidatus Magnetomorum sp. HK-1]